MADDNKKPLVLLVHGAWHQPLHYRALIDALKQKGFTVLAPPLASTGYDDSVEGKTYHDDAKRLRDALLPLLDEGRTAIAIGHSYGSLPMTTAIKGHTVTERTSRGLSGGITSAVYIASTPFFQTGISMFEAGGKKYTSDWFHDVDEKRLPLKLEIAKEAFYSGAEQSLKDQAASYLCHQARAPFETPVDCTPAELEIPKTFVICAEDKIFPKDLQAYTAEQWKASPVELVSGHSPWLNEANRDKIVELVVNEAARA
ncbi:Pyrethroid hydrolase-like protein [Hapsidospora chrysogenum ATCC 11550]|uniref:Pyrethroid hydrolase-like protein n=1 Tax=Hapsidospora chrysogenum (strain ATCC 11550 / CBS 779.69 / DSM 880 / IAM 14645 / JCM 23072 / IMI 49137) TaxID=857340 RepID=A0A086TD91_HAPC1|nr:Pyrethroid hydrolase-like protein [Hapsidospora chrysogenum ATCC 11550]